MWVWESKEKLFFRFRFREENYVRPESGTTTTLFQPPIFVFIISNWNISQTFLWETFHVTVAARTISYVESANHYNTSAEEKWDISQTGAPTKNTLHTEFLFSFINNFLLFFPFIAHLLTVNGWMLLSGHKSHNVLVNLSIYLCMAVLSLLDNWVQMCWLSQLLLTIPLKTFVW